MSSLAQLLEQACEAVEASADLSALDDVRVKYLGRKGLLTAELKGLGKLPPEQRAAAGKEINEVKQALGSAIDSRQAALEAERIQAALDADRLDVTLPGRGHSAGSVHPVTRTLRRIREIFAMAGFEVQTGPEIEDDYHNFTALNIPEDHPARRDARYLLPEFRAAAAHAHLASADPGDE